MNSRSGRALLFWISAFLAVAAAFPIAWVLISSFKPQSELFAVPLSLLPKRWTLANYVEALGRGNFLRYFSNTAFVAITSTILTVVINLMAGYALSKYRFPGRDLIFSAMLATLMIPLQVVMVPIFLQLKAFGLLNSLWGIIIPPAATPTGVFLARQYIQTLPDSLIEAARIDGGGELRIFVRIVAPLAKPVTATIAIFSFMWRWNDFLWPLIVITDNRKQTMQQALANFVGQLQINWSNLLAMTTIAIVPMILVFLIFQRYFLAGLTAGAVKG